MSNCGHNPILANVDQNDVVTHATYIAPGDEKAVVGVDRAKQVFVARQHQTQHLPRQGNTDVDDVS